MLKCIDKVCFAGGKRNEDLVLVTERFALMLDGSTNLDFYEGQPDAGWLVSSFADAFDACFDEKDIKASVSNALIRLRNQYVHLTCKAPEQELSLPSASFSVIYEHEGSIVVGLLGDCTVFVYPKSGKPYTLYQNNVEKFDQKVICEMQRISTENGITPSQAVSLPYIKSLLQKNRSLMNTENGYWILSLCLSAIEHMTVYTLPSEDVAYIMQATDGFDIMREQFLQGVPQKSLADVYADKFNAEEADADFSQYPRFKLHDDASCILLENK